MARRISTGTVDAILDRVGDALEQPYEHLLGGMRRSRALNIDETGWRLKGAPRTLWGVFTEKRRRVQITANRHEEHARAARRPHRDRDLGSLVGLRPPAARASPGLLVTPPARLQSARRRHRRRTELGEHGLRICERVFWAWEVYQHTHDRRQLQRTIRELRREFKPILRQYRGKAPRYKHCRGIARNLLKAWPALWTFARHPGVTPTNNHAERGLRGAVIYRKLSLGSQSDAGEHRIERLLSASTTCRLQHRSLFSLPRRLLAAHTRGDPAPNLA